MNEHGGQRAERSHPITEKAAKKAAVACGAAGLALAAAVPSALAAAGHSHYASFDFAGESVTDPAINFPPTHITTDKHLALAGLGPEHVPQRLDALRPGLRQLPGQALRPAPLGQGPETDPSTTVVHFERPPAPGTWGFALGDVDAEKVQVTAYDAAGNRIPTSALGFQSSFNFCQSGPPRPGSCAGQNDTDQPVWDAGSSYLVGNVADTNGASGWFRPAAEVTTLELYSVVQTGIPVYQFWLAANDQPQVPMLIRRRETAPPALTPPGTPVVIPVCEGTSKNIDLISGAEHGTITSHANCTVTYAPDPGFTGNDSFTLRIETADGRILVRSFDVKVARSLPVTGAPDALPAEAGAALALLGAGAVLTVATRKARKA